MQIIIIIQVGKKYTKEVSMMPYTKVTPEVWENIHRELKKLSPVNWKERVVLSKGFGLSTATLFYIEKSNSLEEYQELAYKRKARKSPKSFSGKLKEYRNAHKLSQEELARLLRVDQNSISLWEAGRHPRKKNKERFLELYREYKQTREVLPQKEKEAVQQPLLPVQPSPAQFALTGYIGDLQSVLNMVAQLKSKGTLSDGVKVVEIKRVVKVQLKTKQTIIAEEVKE